MIRVRAGVWDRVRIRVRIKMRSMVRFRFRVRVRVRVRVRMTSLATGTLSQDAIKGSHDKNVKGHGEKAGYDVNLP